MNAMRNNKISNNMTFYCLFFGNQYWFFKTN